MTIISIDGAGAAGKTTTSASLATHNGTFHIPEVATWWKKPEQEYPEWFFERQVERWKIAIEKEQDGLVIIDIDLFQPFWYNWAFDFTLFGGQTLEFVEDFYRPLLSQRKLGFPDKYFILYTNETNLRERKANDKTRLRRGFELNLKFIEPQKRYFQALNDFCPGLVCFIESVDIESNVKKIRSGLPSCKNTHRYSIELFDFMVDWLRTTASDYAYWTYKNSGVEQYWSNFDDFLERYNSAKKQMNDILTDHQEYDLKQRIELVVNGTESIKRNKQEVTDYLYENYWNTYKSKCFVKEEIKEVIAELKNQFHLAIVSNFMVKNGIEELLCRNKLSNEFEFIVTSINFGWRKPDSRIYKFALEKTGCRADEILFIGDDYENDYIAPRKYGMGSLWLKKGQEVKIGISHFI